MKKYKNGCKCMYENRLMFDWFTTGETLIMPTIGHTLRINNCPTCGFYVRDMIINGFNE